MDSQDALHRLIGRVYEAVENPSLWPFFLQELSDVLSGTVTVLLYYDRERDWKGGISQGVRFDPDAQLRYNAHYEALDEWANAGRGTALLNKKSFVVMGQELCPESLLERTEFYNDFCHKVDIHHLISTGFAFDKSCTGVVSTFRPRGAGPFEAQEARLLEALTPHLLRGFQLHRRLALAESQAKALSEGLESFHQGVLVVNDQGKCLWMNRSAQAMLDQNDGLGLDSNGLRAAQHSQTLQLRKLIRDAADMGAGIAVRSGGVLNVGRPSMQRPFHLLVLPLQSMQFPGDKGRPAAVIFVTDPEAEPKSNESVLCRLFGLTAAEARLAALMARGMSMQECCDQLCIRRNTAHSQLKRVFEKTGVNRQAELVRLLLSSPAGLRFS